MRIFTISVLVVFWGLFLYGAYVLLGVFSKKFDLQEPDEIERSHPMNKRWQRQ